MQSLFWQTEEKGFKGGMGRFWGALYGEQYPGKKVRLKGMTICPMPGIKLLQQTYSYAIL
jgi:hypothetical protein